VSEIARSILLGLVQGVTEFLPVSSSGHLTVILALTGWEESLILPLAVALHLSTTLVVLVYFRREFTAMVRGLLTPRSGQGAVGRRLVLLVMAGTLPTAVIGLSFKDFFERLFSSPAFVAVGWAVTGFILLAAERASRRPNPVALSAGRAFLVGVAQGVAIAPGVSRSGATIGASLLLGIRREEAFAFSFLLSVPSTFGAVLLEARDLGRLAGGDIIPLAIGMAISFAAGWWALAFLSRRVREGRLLIFSLYCWIAAALLAAALAIS
jgi:undecaprenyl-diphosphatase